ncbi:MAG: hypothetical protein ACXVPU_18135 [Bacteroidia bacterium]
MKKLFALMFVAGAFCIMSCKSSGPTDEEKAAIVKKQMDSIAAIAAASMPAMPADTAAKKDTTKAK